MKMRELQQIEPYAGFLSLFHAYHTRTGYTQDLRNFKVYLDSEGLDPFTATRKDLLRFAASLSQPGVTPSGRPRGRMGYEAIDRTMTAVRGLYRYLLALGDIKDDPSSAFYLVRIKKPFRKPKILHPLDRVALLNALRTNCAMNRETSLAVRLGFECGLRVGELVTLRRQDVDLVRRELTVIGKGDKERTVPIPTDALAELLAEWFRSVHPGAAYVFTNLRRPMTDHAKANSINRLMKRAARWAGIAEDLTVHTLRRSGATQMAECGATTYEIRDWLGHNHTTTTDLYVKLASDGPRRAAVRAFEAFGTPKPQERVADGRRHTA